MSIQSSRRALRLSAPLGGMLLLALAGCSGNQQPLQPGESAAYKPADSVYRENAPNPRATDLQNHLNRLRRESFATTPADLNSSAYDAVHNNAVYTAAYRHAVYLNTLNSSDWNSKTESGFDTDALNADDSTLEDLLEEPLLPGTATPDYPALVTAVTPYQRIEAIRNGRNVLNSAGSDPRNVGEAYVFNGDIWRKDGTPSEFRGYNKDTLSDSDPTKYAFDAIDNVWYTAKGRMMLARPSLRYFGYGNRSDSGQIPEIRPPFPIFNNRFLGVMNMVWSAPMVSRISHWPTSFNNTVGNRVHPYGLDTTMNGPNQYSGPPIHFTIPVDEPFLRDIGVVKVEFGRDDLIDPVAAPHNNPAWRRYRVFSNVSGLIVQASPIVGGAYRPAGPPAPVVVDAPVVVSNAVVWDLPRNNQMYTIQLSDTTDLSGVAVGNTLSIKIAAGFPRSGTTTFLVSAVDNTAHTVSFWIPVGGFGQGPFPAEQFPATVYGGDLNNVRVDITNPTATSVTAIVDENLRNGELLIVPTAPLQNNTVYRVTVRVRTASYDSTDVNWTFTTDGTGAYP